MRQIVAVFIFFLIMSLPYSCEDGCDSATFSNTITEISADIGIKTLAFESRSNINSTDAVFEVRIEDIEQEQIASSTVKFDGLVAKTFAESCPLFIELKYELNDIRITSSMAVSFVGNTISAGEDLSSYFRAKQPFESGLIPIEELIQTINFEQNYWFSSAGDGVEFRFNQVPDQNIEGFFTFEFTFENSILSASTSNVTITVN